MYRNPVAHLSRVLPVDINTPGADVGRDRGLQPVTAALIANENMADVAFWLYTGNGYDDWVLCEGVDVILDGSETLDIWTHSGCCLRRHATDVVFVKRDDLDRLGYAVPEAAQPWLW